MARTTPVTGDNPAQARNAKTWYPYAIPALHAGLAGPDQPTPHLLGYLTVPAVGVLAVTATIRWWQHTDHTQ